MADKPTISEDDKALFLEQASGARKLEHNKVNHPTTPVKPIPVQRIPDEKQVLDDMFSDESYTAEVETGDELFFYREGLQQKLLKQLRRGQLSVTAELDLHGYIVADARIALTEFLKDCRRHGDRCVRIVHGKGHGSRQKLPVLKNKVNSWLQQRDEILAFCSARPADGGTGAVYVLLKRS
ncbi:MAG: Smr/MutS family protein [Sulfuriflexus sp.]|nr:Smr/MutS family protein [Sulfuriflexus sp.]